MELKETVATPVVFVDPPSGSTASAPVTPTPPTAGPFNGVKASSSTRAALSTTQALKRGVEVVAELANGSEVVHVGGAAVTVANGRPLYPGETCYVEIDDLAKVFVISTNAANVRYLGT